MRFATRVDSAARPSRSTRIFLCWLVGLAGWIGPLSQPTANAGDFKVTENAEQIQIVGPELEATIRKRGYVSGVAAGSLVDRRPAFATPASGWTLSTG